MVGGTERMDKKHLINLQPGQAKGSLLAVKGSHFWRRCGREWKQGALVDVQHEDQARMMTNRAWRVQNSCED